MHSRQSSYSGDHCQTDSQYPSRSSKFSTVPYTQIPINSAGDHQEEDGFAGLRFADTTGASLRLDRLQRSAEACAEQPRPHRRCTFADEDHVVACCAHVSPACGSRCHQLAKLDHPRRDQEAAPLVC